MTRVVYVGAALALVYGLTLGSLAWEDLVLGFAVGALLVALTQSRLRAEPRGTQPPLLGRLLWLPVFALAVLVDVLRSTWDVGLRVVHLRSFEHPGTVRIPIGERTERGAAVSALVMTLAPGSVLLELDWERGHMLFHAVDARDPEALRADAARFYDRYQRRVFP